MYSSGIPILYPLAFVFYVIVYWVYKCLLLKFYRTTSNFNERLVLESISLIKYGIYLHMLLGVVMFSNSNILSSEVKASLSDWTSALDLLPDEVQTMLDRFATRHS